MSNEVRYDGRSWSTLWQTRAVTYDLRENGRYIGREREVFILDEVAAHSPKVDSRKEILQVEIEYEAPPAMNTGICHNRTVRDKAMDEGTSMSLIRL
jgi:hypothetical protein